MYKMNRNAKARTVARAHAAVCLFAAALVTPLGQRVRPYSEDDPYDLEDMERCLAARNAAAARGAFPLECVREVMAVPARLEVKAAVVMSMNPLAAEMLAGFMAAERNA